MSDRRTDPGIICYICSMHDHFSPGDWRGGLNGSYGRRDGTCSRNQSTTSTTATAVDDYDRIYSRAIAAMRTPIPSQTAHENSRIDPCIPRAYGPYFACNLHAIYIEITVFLGRQYILKLHADCGHYIDQESTTPNLLKIDNRFFLFYILYA